jgi:tRNA(Ile)-lysidine synthase
VPSQASGRPLVLVACSGGPDSLALAAAAAFVAPRLGLRAGAVVVDHGLQAGSAQVAASAARACAALGLDPVDVVRVEVAGADGEGPEAAAREARYRALDQHAADRAAVAVLLGHTRDDQAEAVLLGLLRGSGARSLAGMPRRRGIYRRPFLDLPRATTAEACIELGLEPWTDPHNADPAYARVRARDLLAELEHRIGPGTSAGLARSADLLRADSEALDLWAAREYARQPAHHPSTATQLAHQPSTGSSADGLDCTALAALPGAVRTRVIRLAALAAGVRPADLSSAQLRALDALVADWHGQGAVALPGRLVGSRRCGRLQFAGPSTPSAPDDPEE